MAQREEIRVFLSSPGDCQPERDAVSRVLDEMNRTVGERERLFFELLRWEDLPPGIGRNPQAVIDEQLGAYNVLSASCGCALGHPFLAVQDPEPNTKYSKRLKAGVELVNRASCSISS